MENNFDLKKFLVENRLTVNSKILKESSTPRYPEGKLSIEDKIKALVPLWQQHQDALADNDMGLLNQIDDKISLYTTYDNEYGGGSYRFAITDYAKSAEDVAKIVKREEAKLASDTEETTTHSVKLLVPVVYYNTETGELSDNKYEWYTEDELQDGADQTSYTDGEELDDVVFSNDYDQAKNFEKEYSSLLKVN